MTIAQLFCRFWTIGSSDRRRRYSRSLSRERIYRRGGNGSPDSYRENSDQGYDRGDRSGYYQRRDRRDRDRYGYRGRASSESSNDSYGK